MKLNAKGRSSDLLPVFCLPVTDTETVTYRLKNVIELTAAGQYRFTLYSLLIPGVMPETKSSANVVKKV